MQKAADNTENTVINETLCRQMLVDGLAPVAIEEELQKKGIDTDTITAYLKEIKRMRNAKKQFNGFIYMGAGAFLGFLSCVLTITHAIPQMHGFIFYGLTVMAIFLVFIGFYLVFE